VDNNNRQSLQKDSQQKKKWTEELIYMISRDYLYFKILSFK
jgi:hypothetical protein